jgi:hypothetical protein
VKFDQDNGNEGREREREGERVDYPFQEHLHSACLFKFKNNCAKKNIKKLIVMKLHCIAKCNMFLIGSVEFSSGTRT